MATSIDAKPRMMFLRLLCIGAGVLLLAGCTLLPPAAADELVEGASSQLLPMGWETIGGWQPVNLDDDEEEEHLLLFRFDNGQVGALIFEGDPATSISTPELLLPRHFDGQGALGLGVIAPPGTTADEIMIAQVDGDIPARELMVLGGKTNLTFAWWKGPGNGYGVTQLYAPGGFGVDWETWLDDPMPLTSVMGYYPLEDFRARANICRLVQYTRRTDLPSDFPTIIYSAQPQGLHFCGSTIPTYPFAPEGVVLAYLRWPRAADAEMIKLLTPGTTLAQLDAESAAERWPLERIEDIAAYPAVTLSNVAANTPRSPTTTVCVEFAEVANPALRRWVLYTLRYQPADAAQRLPDRWTVSSAFTEPPPLEPPASGYCNTILERNAP